MHFCATIEPFGIFACIMGSHIDVGLGGKRFYDFTKPVSRREPIYNWNFPRVLTTKTVVVV